MLNFASGLEKWPFEILKFNILKITKTMGRIKKGILGGFSGKVGSVVGASWKSIDYIRSLPASVRNPRTPAQVDQRSKFATVIKFLTKFTPILNIGFRNFANNQTAINAAMSYHIHNAVIGQDGEYEIDYEKVMISRGPLYKPLLCEAMIDNGEIAIGWDPKPLANGSSDDYAIVLLYNKTKDEVIVDVNGETRSRGYTGVDFHDHWLGDELEVYIGFVSDDGKLISDSMYMGCFKLPDA